MELSTVNNQQQFFYSLQENKTNILYNKLLIYIVSQQYDDAARVCAEIGQLHLGTYYDSLGLNQVSSEIGRLGQCCLVDPACIVQLITGTENFVSLIQKITNQAVELNISSSMTSNASAHAARASLIENRAWTPEQQQIARDLKQIELLCYAPQIRLTQLFSIGDPNVENIKKRFSKIFDGLRQQNNNESCPLGQREALLLYSYLEEGIDSGTSISLEVFEEALKTVDSTHFGRHGQIHYAQLLLLSHESEIDPEQRQKMSFILLSFIQQIANNNLLVSASPTLEEATYLGDLASLLHDICKKIFIPYKEKLEVLGNNPGTLPEQNHPVSLMQFLQLLESHLQTKRNESIGLSINYLKNYAKEGWRKVYSEWIYTYLLIHKETNLSPILAAELLTFLNKYASQRDQLANYLKKHLEKEPSKT